MTSVLVSQFHVYLLWVNAFSAIVQLRRSIVCITNIYYFVQLHGGPRCGALRGGRHHELARDGDGGKDTEFGPNSIVFWPKSVAQISTFLAQIFYVFGPNYNVFGPNYNVFGPNHYVFGTYFRYILPFLAQIITILAQIITILTQIVTFLAQNQNNMNFNVIIWAKNGTIWANIVIIWAKIVRRAMYFFQLKHLFCNLKYNSQHSHQSNIAKIRNIMKLST